MFWFVDNNFRGKHVIEVYDDTDNTFVSVDSDEMREYVCELAYAGKFGGMFHSARMALFYVIPKLAFVDANNLCKYNISNLKSNLADNSESFYPINDILMDEGVVSSSYNSVYLINPLTFSLIPHFVALRGKSLVLEPSLVGKSDEKVYALKYLENSPFCYSLRSLDFKMLFLNNKWYLVVATLTGYVYLDAKDIVTGSHIIIDNKKCVNKKNRCSVRKILPRDFKRKCSNIDLVTINYNALQKNGFTYKPVIEKKEEIVEEVKEIVDTKEEILEEPKKEIEIKKEVKIEEPVVIEESKIEEDEVEVVKPDLVNTKNTKVSFDYTEADVPVKPEHKFKFRKKESPEDNIVIETTDLLGSASKVHTNRKSFFEKLFKKKS